MAAISGPLWCFLFQPLAPGALSHQVGLIFSNMPGAASAALIFSTTQCLLPYDDLPIVTITVYSIYWGPVFGDLKKRPCVVILTWQGQGCSQATGPVISCTRPPARTPTNAGQTPCW